MSNKIKSNNLASLRIEFLYEISFLMYLVCCTFYTVDIAIFCFKGEPFTTVEEAKIPLLKEVFEKFPKVAINIDIKVDNDLLISKVEICFKFILHYI